MAARCRGCGRLLPFWLWFSREIVCARCAARMEAARQAALQQYHAAVKQTLSDGVITPREWAALEDLRGRLGVEPHDAFETHRGVLQSLCDHALQSRDFSPLRLASLENLAKQLRLPPRVVDQALTRITLEVRRSEAQRSAERHRREFERKEEIRRQQEDTHRRARALRESEVARLREARDHSLEALKSGSPREFEDAIARLFRKLGYSVTQTPYTSDGGRDAIAQKDGRKYGIECKRYGRKNNVGRPQLQQFYAVLRDEGAVSGFYVTTGRFTSGAVEYALRHSIELVDAQRLALLLQQAFPRAGGASTLRSMCLQCGDIVVFSLSVVETGTWCRRGHFVPNDFTQDMLSTHRSANETSCDVCGREMRVRRGSKGQFWGCTGYPECRNTKPYRGKRG
jgi:hypothetical protein